MKSMDVIFPAITAERIATEIGTTTKESVDHSFPDMDKLGVALRTNETLCGNIGFAMSVVGPFAACLGAFLWGVQIGARIERSTKGVEELEKMFAESKEPK